jgi:hypothetical protein
MEESVMNMAADAYTRGSVTERKNFVRNITTTAAGVSVALLIGMQGLNPRAIASLALNAGGVAALLNVLSRRRND